MRGFSKSARSPGLAPAGGEGRISKHDSGHHSTAGRACQRAPRRHRAARDGLQVVGDVDHAIELSCPRAAGAHMANDEDVTRLRQGTAVWNAWRARNPERRGPTRRTSAGRTSAGRTSRGRTSAGVLPHCEPHRGEPHRGEPPAGKTFGNRACGRRPEHDEGPRCLRAHEGPSIIDHRTLQRSGRLPLAFLRGCGLPDRLIDYLPSLLEEAIQYYVLHQLLVERRCVRQAAAHRPSEHRRALLVRAARSADRREDVGHDRCSYQSPGQGAVDPLEERHR